MTSSERKKIKVKVFRYNPLKDKEGYYKTYEVQCPKSSSAMRVLEDIHKNIDGTLAFPHHALCQHGACGVCTIMVNGKAIRACQFVVTDDIEELVIEPLSKPKVIKDLVIER
jgi:succinate dehydrogenase/fumarate reductase-like Fe-S protein